MRALSLLQPYASAIIIGPKRIENRTRVIWYPPSGGQWVAVHASAGWYDVDPDAWMQAWPGSPGLSTTPQARDESGARIGGRATLDRKAFTRGALLGVMHVVGVATYGELGSPSTAEAKARAERELGAWAFGPVCYIIGAVHALKKPIPAAGQRCLWTVPAEHTPALQALLPAGAIVEAA